MEECHPAVHQPDDGGSAVSSQVARQATLITQVHNADANTWCNVEKKQTAVGPHTVEQSRGVLAVKENTNYSYYVSDAGQQKQDIQTRENKITIDNIQPVTCSNS